MKNHVFLCKSGVFLRKKSPRQGCTKPKTELGMHQNPHFHQNPLKINKNPKISPPSTITIPESDLTSWHVHMSACLSCIVATDNHHSLRAARILTRVQEIPAARHHAHHRRWVLTDGPSHYPRGRASCRCRYSGDT